MKEYIVKIPEEDVENISLVLEKFGIELSPAKIKNDKKE